MKEFSRRDIGQKQKSLRDRSARDTVMQDLTAWGWVKPIDRDIQGPCRWAVNPAVRERFAARAEYEREDRAMKRAAIERAGRAKNEWLAQGGQSDAEF